MTVWESAHADFLMPFLKLVILNSGTKKTPSKQYFCA